MSLLSPALSLPTVAIFLVDLKLKEKKKCFQFLISMETLEINVGTDISGLKGTSEQILLKSHRKLEAWHRLIFFWLSKAKMQLVNILNILRVKNTEKSSSMR